MKFLLLNQTFYPDNVATAQYLSILAAALAERGHDVTVVASRRAYDEPATLFPKRETWRGIKIHRIATTRFGKSAKWRRAADFASFICTCCARLLTLPKPDAVIALTSPPLISFIGAAYTKLRGAKFFYWVMDLNPDEALAAGWLREGTMLTRLLERISRFSLRHAEKIIALDQFMKERIERKGIAAGKIEVIPPWSQDGAVKFDASGREQFRAAHGLTGKFVVMYSGNHSPCHPLDTLLAAAEKLSNDPRFVFLFVGGGSEWRRIKENVSAFQNVFCLPYQPLSNLSASLSAADLHAVVMGDNFVGTIHPCKIYNILNVRAPLLCIGPARSHLSGILAQLNSPVCAAVRHGDVESCVREIQKIASQNRRGDEQQYAAVAAEFAEKKLMEKLVAELEGVAAAGTK